MFVSALPHREVLERVVRQSSATTECLWVAHYARLALAGQAGTFQFDLWVREAEAPTGVPLTFVALWDHRGELSVAFACFPPSDDSAVAATVAASTGRGTVVDEFLATLSASLTVDQKFTFALMLDTFLPRLAASWSWTDADVYPCVERRLVAAAADTWPVDDDIVPTLDASGRRVRIGMLTEADAAVAWAHWPYRAERPVTAIALLLRHLRSAAVFVDDEPGNDVPTDLCAQFLCLSEWICVWLRLRLYVSRRGGVDLVVCSQTAAVRRILWSFTLCASDESLCTGVLCWRGKLLV
jgi:hypothetical protein